MSLMVDPSMRWIFVIIAGDMWPELDEDAIRALARIVQDAGSNATNAAGGLDSLVLGVTSNVHGNAGRAFARYGHQLNVYGDSFGGSTRSMASLLEDFALQGENAKYSILIASAFTGAEILWALSSPFTAPLVPEFIAIARARVLQRMAQYFGRVKSMIAIATLSEAAEELVQSGLAQLIQIAEGNRKSLDLKDLAMAAGFGAGAGFFASSLTAGMRRWIRDRTDGPGRHFNSNTVTRAAFVEAMTELAIGAATIPLGGDPSALWMGAVNGIASGYGEGYAEHQGEKWREAREKNNRGPDNVDLDDIPLLNDPGDNPNSSDADPYDVGDDDSTWNPGDTLTTNDDPGDTNGFGGTGTGTGAPGTSNGGGTTGNGASGNGRSGLGGGDRSTSDSTSASGAPGRTPATSSTSDGAGARNPFDDSFAVAHPMELPRTEYTPVEQGTSDTHAAPNPTESSQHNPTATNAPNPTGTTTTSTNPTGTDDITDTSNQTNPSTTSTSNPAGKGATSTGNPNNPASINNPGGTSNTSSTNQPSSQNPATRGDRDLESSPSSPVDPTSTTVAPPTSLEAAPPTGEGTSLESSPAPPSSVSTTTQVQTGTPSTTLNPPAATDQQQPEQATRADVERWVRTERDAVGPYAISFPITDDGGRGLDSEALLDYLARAAPTDVTVSARVRDGRVMIGDREIPLPVFADILKDRTPGKRIVLTMPGGADIGPRLKVLMGQEVVVWDPEFLIDPGPTAHVPQAPPPFEDTQDTDALPTITVTAPPEDVLSQEDGALPRITVTPPPEDVVPIPAAMPTEDILFLTRTLVDADGPMLISFPVNDDGDIGIDDETSLELAKVPVTDVAVSAHVRDNRIMAGELEIPLATFAAILTEKADGRRIVLTMPGAENIAEQLRPLMGQEVVTRPAHLAVDPAAPGIPWPHRPVQPEPTQPPPEASGSGQERTPAPDPDGTNGTDGGQDRTPDEAVAFVGVPRAGLPGLSDLVHTLREVVDLDTVPDSAWAALPQHLLSNYRYLPHISGANNPIVPGPAADGAAQAAPVENISGIPVRLGNREVLISLELEYDGKASDTAGGAKNFKAVGSINSSFVLGSYEQRHSGQTLTTGANLSFGFGFGAGTNELSVVSIGVGVSAVMNQNNRMTNRVVDAEGGHVEDNRGAHSLLQYKAKWVVRVREDVTIPWVDQEKRVVPRRPDPRQPQDGQQRAKDPRLFLWVADHYLAETPKQLVAANPVPLNLNRLPDYFFASGATNLPRLFDETARILNDNGVDLSVQGVTNRELVQKLWNLDANLDDAINKPGGYNFYLHDKHGVAIAKVEVHTTRAGTPRRIGATSKESHVENVRTAIDGTGGSHSVTHSTGVSPVNVTLGLRSLNDSDGGLNISAGPTVNFASTDGISDAKNGLWVLVPRFIGNTNGYQTGVTHQVRISVRNGNYDEQPRTVPVPGTVMLRLPEPMAFDHGFTVDEDALKEPPTTTNTDGTPTPVPHGDDVIRGSMSSTKPPPETAPHFVHSGLGTGMGLVMARQDTVDDLLNHLVPELRWHGFLPPAGDAMRDQSWYKHGENLDSQLENEAQLEKLVSLRGLESHYDQIHQDGLTFTLVHKRGGAGLTVDHDHAKITIKAKRSLGRLRSPDSDEREPTVEYLGTTDQYAAVNLGMGMAVSGMSTGGSRRLTIGAKLSALARVLKTGGMGIGYTRGVSANNNITHLNNRPELLEFPGELKVFELTSDYVVEVEYQHSGRQGKTLPGRRGTSHFEVPYQKSKAMMVPLGDETGLDRRPWTIPPASVLDHAVVSYLDTSGIRDLLRSMLTSLTGPAGFADQEMNTFSGTIVLRAFLKEIINGEFSTDQFFESGWFRDKHAAASIDGKLGATRYVGATASDFVLGIIKLSLTIAGDSSTRSSGWIWEQLDLLLGEAAAVGPTGTAGIGASKSRQKNKTTGLSRTGGKELLQLDFNRALTFESEVDLEVAVKEERRGKIGSAQKDPLRESRRKVMRFMLPEPEALDKYAKHQLPIADEQVKDAMRRWEIDDKEQDKEKAKDKLHLSGNVVAGVLSRLASPAPGRIGPIHPDLHRWATLLAERHASGDLHTVMDPDRRAEFTTVFGIDLADMPSPYADLVLPEYLNKPNTHDNFLGHSGVYETSFRDPRDQSETSLYKVIKRLVDEAAPGLMTTHSHVWDAQGRHIGTLQGADGTLKTLFGKGRDHSLWDDLLSEHGTTLYFTNQLDWVKSDVVAVNVAGMLTSKPEIIDKRKKAGVEVYEHNQGTRSTGETKDVTQGFSTPKLNVSTEHGSWSGNTRVGQGSHRGTTHTEQLIAEQTAYDWDTYYIARFSTEVKVTVSKLDMNARPINNHLLHHWPASRPRPGEDGNAHTETVTGTLDLEVPRSIAESRPQIGPNKRDFKPMGDLPGDAMVVGTLLDDTVPLGFSMLRNIFGEETSGIVKHSSLNLPMLLSRLHLNNHMQEAIAGKEYTIARDLILPGHSSDRLTIKLVGDLYDAEVLNEFDGAGTGRYSKSLESTTVSGTSDHWRLSAETGGAANVVTHQQSAPNDQPVPPDHTFNPTQNASRTSPAGTAAADNTNLRREQHVKQIVDQPEPAADEQAPAVGDEHGTVVLARMRGRFRLVAELNRHHLITTEPTFKGSFESEAVTGDVYAHLFRADFDEMRDRPATGTNDGVDQAYLDAADPEARRRGHGARGHDRPGMIGRVTTVSSPSNQLVRATAERLAPDLLRMHRDGVRPTIVIYGQYGRKYARGVALALARKLASELERRQGPSLLDSVTALVPRRRPAPPPPAPRMTLSDIDVRLRGPAVSNRGGRINRISITLMVQSRNGDTAGSWRQADLTPTLDLNQLMDETPPKYQNAFRVHEHLAKTIRHHAGGDLAVELDLDRRAQKRVMWPPVLQWAADTMNADIATANQRGATNVVTSAYLDRINNAIANPAQLDDAGMNNFLNEVLDEVNRVRDGNRPPNMVTPPEGGDPVPAPWPTPLPPLARPQRIPLLDLPVGPLARQIAFELGAPIRINETLLDGSEIVWEATPSGDLIRTPPEPPAPPDPYDAVRALLPAPGQPPAPEPVDGPPAPAPSRQHQPPAPTRAPAPRPAPTREQRRRPTPQHKPDPTAQPEPKPEQSPPAPTTPEPKAGPAPSPVMPTLANALATEARTSPQAARLHALITQPGQPAEPGQMADAFTALRQENVVNHLDLPTADAFLLDLTATVARGEVSAAQAGIAIGLFRSYGLLARLFQQQGQAGWDYSDILNQLLETINRLNATDENTNAEKYVQYLRKHTR